MKRLDEIMEAIFKENQDKLAPEKKSASFSEEVCGVKMEPDHPDATYTCTRPEGHKGGPHIAHDLLGYIVKEWQ